MDANLTDQELIDRAKAIMNNFAVEGLIRNDEFGIPHVILKLDLGIGGIQKFQFGIRRVGLDGNRIDVFSESIGTTGNKF